MKGIKRALLFLAGAGYASLWWAATLFGTGLLSPKPDLLKVLWTTVSLSTVLLAILVVRWLFDNWDKD